MNWIVLEAVRSEVNQTWKRVGLVKEERDVMMTSTRMVEQRKWREQENMIDMRMVSFCFHSITLVLHLDCILFFDDEDHYKWWSDCVFVFKEMLPDYYNQFDSLVLLIRCYQWGLFFGCILLCWLGFHTSVSQTLSVIVYPYITKQKLCAETTVYLSKLSAIKRQNR